VRHALYHPTVGEVQQRAVSPGEEFYRTYSAAQVGVIVGALTQRAEFPYELTYVGGSALWHAGEVSSNADNAPVLGDMDTLLTRHAEQLLALVPSWLPVQVSTLDRARHVRSAG